MIKILFIIDGLNAGGKERQLYEIMKVFSEASHLKTGIIIFNKNNHYSDRIKKKVNYFVELNKRPTRLEPFFTIWKHIRGFKPDIIHTWDSLSSMYACFPVKFFKIKFIDGSIRDAGIEKGWQLFLKKYFLKRADLIIANSKAGLHYYKIRGEVIYNAIDTRRFYKRIKTGKINIIMVANFTDYKDHKTFINAAIKLLNNKQIDNVYFAGDGPHKQIHIDNLKKNYPGIFLKFHFLGLTPNIEKYLAKCKFGILCSTSAYSEGISNSVLEYMAAGLIPIVTDVGGSSEIISDTNNGYLIKSGDSDKIVEIIEHLRSDTELFRSITKSAQKTIRLKFDLKKNVKSIENIYHSLLHNNK